MYTSPVRLMISVLVSVLTARYDPMIKPVIVMATREMDIVKHKLLEVCFIFSEFSSPS